MHKNKFLLMLLCCLLIEASLAHPALLSLEMHDVPLALALHTIAKLAHIKIFIAPDVAGNTNVLLHNIAAEEALSFLCEHHGLVPRKIKGVWYVSSLHHLIKHAEEKKRWQALLEAQSPLHELSLHIKYANAEDLVHFIKDGQSSYLSKRGIIKADKRTNSIYLLDLTQKVALIKKLIKTLDVAEPQVLVEAKIFSVDYDYEKDLGIQFGYPAGKEKTEDNSSFAMAIVFSKRQAELNLRLSALEQKGVLTLLSNPRLYTKDREEATIEAGEEMPYQEVSEGGGTGLAFKKAVLALRVRPEVLAKNEVLLSLQINQDRPSKRLIKGMPTISTRQMITAVRVKNGQTVVLGGIFETIDEKGLIKLPFLSNIPIVGELFKHRNKRENKRELLIFITPKIIA